MVSYALIDKITKYSHKTMWLVFKIQCCDWFLEFLNMVIKRWDWFILQWLLLERLLVKRLLLRWMLLRQRFPSCLDFIFVNFEQASKFQHKAPSAKQTTFTLWKCFAHEKNCCLCCLVLAYFCFISWFVAVTCFCGREIFL